LYAANQPLTTLRVRKGEADEVGLVVHRDVFATLPRGQADDIAATIDIPDPFIAPLQKDQTIGTLRLTRGDETLAEEPVYPAADVAEAGFFSRLIDDLKMRFE
jgi:D-alanyl-D-alanine carboxypeptidase (penicillin-binding protein 5/6)